MTEQGQEGTAPESDAGPSPASVEPGAPDTDADDRITPSARVVLVGLPGSGKSTIGRKLARELGVALYDTDAGIEDDTGRTIPDIFATDGEVEFRRIEEEVVRRAVLSHDGVVSLGGGSVLSERTRELLREATVVYLEISVSEGVRRTGASNTRPLLNGVDPAAKYRDLMRERRPLYRQIATVRVRTDGRSPGRVVRMILAKLGLESVRTDLDATRSTTGNVTAASSSGSVTSRPGAGSNRSKNRRRARARAAAARRGGAEQSGVTATERRGGVDDRNRSAPSAAADGATVDETSGAARTPGAAQNEPRTAGSRRSRRPRSRRGGTRIRPATSAAARDTDTSSGAASENLDGRTSNAESQPGNREAAGGRAGNRNAPGSRTSGRTAVTGASSRGVGRGRRTASRDAGAPGRVGHRGGEPAQPSGSATSDPAKETRTAPAQQVQRAGQPGEADRGAGTNERRRRGQPRRRSGRRNNNDQKESEQRT